MLPIAWELLCLAACAPTALITCTLSLPPAIADCLFCAPRSRDAFLTILEQTRERYRFVVVGYVVMPEHVHLRTARALLPKRKRRSLRQRNLFGDEPKRRAFWQARSYDFNVWTTKKRVEKLWYMHRNPVKRGLVGASEEWRWSSYRFYLLDEAETVRVNEGWTKISFRDRVA
jgi:putative transposase